MREEQPTYEVKTRFLRYNAARAEHQDACDECAREGAHREGVYATREHADGGAYLLLAQHVAVWRTNESAADSEQGGVPWHDCPHGFPVDRLELIDARGLCWVITNDTVSQRPLNRFTWRQMTVLRMRLVHARQSDDAHIRAKRTADAAGRSYVPPPSAERQVTRSLAASYRALCRSADERQ